ncbi:MAG: hypothetical protein R3199_12290 [Gemmatimonadota bacterium]|nr:hypothetical protein [Gemmatimonadota bacterium]
MATDEDNASNGSCHETARGAEPDERPEEGHDPVEIAVVEHGSLQQRTEPGTEDVARRPCREGFDVAGKEKGPPASGPEGLGSLDGIVSETESCRLEPEWLNLGATRAQRVPKDRAARSRRISLERR